MRPVTQDIVSESWVYRRRFPSGDHHCIARQRQNALNARFYLALDSLTQRPALYALFPQPQPPLTLQTTYHKQAPAFHTQAAVCPHMPTRVRHYPTLCMQPNTACPLPPLPSHPPHPTPTPSHSQHTCPVLLVRFPLPAVDAPVNCSQSPCAITGVRFPLPLVRCSVDEKLDLTLTVSEPLTPLPTVPEHTQTSMAAKGVGPRLSSHEFPWVLSGWRTHDTGHCSTLSRPGSSMASRSQACMQMNH